MTLQKLRTAANLRDVVKELTDKYLNQVTLQKLRTASNLHDVGQIFKSNELTTLLLIYMLTDVVKELASK